MSFSIKDLSQPDDSGNPSIGFVGRINRQLLIERIQRLKRERIEASMPEFAEFRRVEQQVNRGEKLE